MPLLIFDTETTGKPLARNAPLNDLSNWPRIVQIAWVLLDDAGRETQHHCQIIRPNGFTIPADAARIHGITTDKALREGVPLKPTLERLRSALAITETTIAHNFEFDYKVTAAEFLRLAMPDPFIGRSHFCTMKSGASVTRIPGRFGDYKWPSLAELHTHLFGEPPEVVHDALADVRTCARCYVAMSRKTKQSIRSPASPAPTDDDEDLISEVEELASDHAWFDPEFVESVRAQYDERGRITDRQRDALRRIREMFHARS